VSGRWRGQLLGARPDEGARKRRRAAGWFVATCVSVFVVHLVGWQAAIDGRSALGSALFAATLMGVLLAHELGHWGFARWRGFRLSLPWFLPAPFLVGTLGAIIRVEERPGTRTDLAGLGVSGPLAGLVAIVAVLVVRSVVGAEGEASDWVLARPLLWWVVGWPLGHTAAPTPTDPLGFAAWIGCLVTAMNLLPFGQLDGGHVMGAVAPRWQRRVGWATTVGLLGLGLAWPPWALWAGTLHLMGASVPLHPKAADQALDREGRALAALGGLAWLLCFTPVPTSW